MTPRLANSAAVSLPGLNVPQSIPFCVDSLLFGKDLLLQSYASLLECSLAQFDLLFHKVVLGSNTFCVGSLWWFGEDSLLCIFTGVFSSSV